MLSKLDTTLRNENGFETTSQIMKQFAHHYHLPSCLCTETCSSVSTVLNYIPICLYILYTCIHVHCLSLRCRYCFCFLINITVVFWKFPINHHLTLHACIYRWTFVTNDVYPLKWTIHSWEETSVPTWSHAGNGVSVIISFNGCVIDHMKWWIFSNVTFCLWLIM